MKTSDFTIWPTSHPIARAASCAVFVPSGNRRTSGSRPSTRAASMNRSIAPLIAAPSLRRCRPARPLGRRAPAPAAPATGVRRPAPRRARTAPPGIPRPRRRGRPASASPHTMATGTDELATQPEDPGRRPCRAATAASSFPSPVIARSAAAIRAAQPQRVRHHVDPRPDVRAQERHQAEPQPARGAGAGLVAQVDAEVARARRRPDGASARSSTTTSSGDAPFCGP